eukprot:TRINITY_DN1119_c0_g3_i1.p1 TRINITY_DN1119_c0_g3~~TRINITY_DN1119_c0_g3_i1.p1  ORF type:complete len:421 (+),score=92.33 TRINITY_DN1119_c0_g3_i1:78-1340(+)
MLRSSKANSSIEGLGLSFLERDKQFVERLIKSLGLKDHRSLKRKEIVSSGGNSILQRYNNSVKSLLATLFPSDQLDTESDHLSTNRLFLEKLATKLKFTSKEDFYGLKVKDLEEDGGHSILSSHHRSPANVVMETFPEHPWEIQRFRKPSGHFNSIENRRKYLKFLEISLKIREMEDWYRLKNSDFYNAEEFLSKYGNSVPRLLQSEFPEHQWERSKFGNSRTPPDLSTLKFRRNFIEKLSQKLKIRSLDDWYRISSKEISQNFPLSTFKKEPLLKLLNETYPQHHFQVESGNRRSSQRRLIRSIEDLFPDCDVRENYRHPELKSNETNYELELDIFIPKLKIAFEYQGEGHFHDIYVIGNMNKVRGRDQLKRDMCQQKGITLVEIPYWWDFQLESLIGTIKKKKQRSITSFGKYKRDSS